MRGGDLGQGSANAGARKVQRSRLPGTCHAWLSQNPDPSATHISFLFGSFNWGESFILGADGKMSADRMMMRGFATLPIVELT